jgi:phenylpropionate dioxygenase-like ring-hydroxylating dioxygenase large terminal subunit
MLTEQQNRLLTEVEGDAPMGRYMRERHWIPCARSASLPAGGAPQGVRLLGKDYVAFRAVDGRVGFFDEKCPHRGASLLLARVEDCALRCIFHAWKFDVSGKVLEVPSEGERSAAFAARVELNHYPTFDGGGLLWVYLGKGAPPARPPLPFMDLDEERLWVSRNITPCNWLQGIEGTIDSIHVGTLHKSWIDSQYGSKESKDAGSIGLTLDTHPRYEVEDTGYGIKAAALRTLPDGRQYIRVTEYVMPFVALVPGGKGDRNGTIFIATPIDNHSHMLFWGFWNEDGPRTPAEQQMTVGVRHPDNWAQIDPGPDRTFGQNREAMAQGHFSGFDQCLVEEDMVVQASMGSIVDRTKEHLCSSDVGIVHTRRRLLEELAAFELGEPLGTAPQVVRPLDLVAAADFAWRDYR